MNANNKFINNCKGHKSNTMSCGVVGVTAVTKGCDSGVICVNQKQSGQKITEKDCTDLQSLVKKSVDDINVLFSLKHIQSSFAGVDGYKRKHQSLSVGKNIQQRFNNGCGCDDNNKYISGSNNKKQQQQQEQQQNFMLNINNYINASSSSSSSNQINKKNTLTIERYNDDNNDCSYDNNTARINNNVKDNNNANTNNHHVMNLNLVKGTNNGNSNSNKKGIVDKKDKRERSINGVIISASEKKKPSYQSYVNVKKKCTKRLYGNNDCNNSVNVNNNNINDISMYANSSRVSGIKGNIKTNRNVSPMHMESSTYRGTNTNNKCKSGLTKKNYFNSAHTSRKLFNKVNQFQQQQQQQQTSFIHQTQSNNTKQHNSTFTSISQLDMMLTQTQQPTQSALTKTISREIDLNYNPTISLTATSTSFTNSASTNTNQQQQQQQHPLSSSSNIIKVQKARSSSITFLTNSTNLNTSLTTTSTRTRHNPSPLHKPSSSLFFSSSNYHSIINKIYSKEFPYNALTTNDILKLMLFLNEYLINSNVFKDASNPQHIQLLSNYSSFLSENITLDYPETEDIDHSKLDKVVNCTKMIQRKWREFTMRTYLANSGSSSKDEIHEIKKMVLNTYIHRTGFKVKKIIGLFNSTCEAFGDIVNDTEMNEMMYNIIKLIKGKLTKCEKHLLYKQYINNIIFNHVM